MSARLVAVVGTVNRDVIVTPGGGRERSLGGILYNALPLVALLEETGFRVRPIGRLGTADRDEAVALFDGFEAFDPTGLIVDPAGTNVSWLDYSEGGERREQVELRVGPITLAELEPARDAEAIAVNMISGQDLAIDTIEELRRDTRAALYLDVQALARTLETPRRPRSVPEWERWAAAFDVVRGNDDEIGWIAGTGGDVPGGVERLLAAGAEEVIVTHGERGATRATLVAGRVRRTEIPARARGAAVDPTGCGDSFLSGVVCGRLAGLPPDDAVALGAWVAGHVVGLSGIEALRELRGARERAIREDPKFAPLKGLRGLPGTQGGSR